jgi:hypothetical protein
MVRKDIQNKGCAEKVLRTHFSKGWAQLTAFLKMYSKKDGRSK